MTARFQKIVLQRSVKATPKRVYQAFTNATVLREWFCDVATLSPKSGGRIYMAWDDGYYTSGSYLMLKEHQQVAFTWYGRGEPRGTRVSIRIKAQKGGVQITLEHSRIGTGKAWAQTAGEFKKEWEHSLDNLASVLETGEDMRLTHRPMIGIGVSDFDEEIARQIGVPVSRGIRLDAVVEGMGAAAAGLHPGDVIVNVDGHDTPDWPSMHNVLQAHRAGDQVEVTFYRGAEKRTATMELSRRPLPQLPTTLSGVADAMRRKLDASLSELDAFLEGITEAEAVFKPEKDAWSVMDVLAHLIHSERGYQRFICDVAGQHQPHYDDYAGNLQAYNDATMAVYPTLAEMLKAVKNSAQETIALVMALPADFVAHKAAFWQLAYTAVEPDYHISTHMEQMRKAVQAARK